MKNPLRSENALEEYATSSTCSVSLIYCSVGRGKASISTIGPLSRLLLFRNGDDRDFPTYPFLCFSFCCEGEIQTMCNIQCSLLTMVLDTTNKLIIGTLTHTLGVS